MVQILVVEDDLNLNEIVCTHLASHGFQVDGAPNANDAFNLMATNLYDIVISDIMMPDIDGFEFATRVRKINRTIPILFMTAKDDFVSKQKGFEIGIDDYMVKPVNLDELVWRIQALIRRAHIDESNQLTIGEFVMDKSSMVVKLKDSEISTTVREFNILFKLLSFPNRTFSREQLLDEFWGVESDSSLRAVDVYITRLREKFAEVSFEIKTVYGLGYKAVVK
ncbi:response regulator transcription factor [Lacticaseibacillus songhuajiangensis]|jgi:DNA-binding response OmpR family regulator|uniref:response regulator transcription factor n=1 Tax=Lacticaseibacillus songhuajiangensis TaxID=1296539 RepID=UPI000F78AE92|nr:response regulator transcription factor [Lacticaseibacillus songhuajiangensis]